jgi:ABC-type transport system involved in multi-copper enzyme maturation permease subunit
MHLPTPFAIRWLVRDTFRQARASGACWLTWTVTAVCVVGCLTLSTDQGGRELQLGLGSWVAGAVGMLLALLWTASLLPTFLQPAAVAVLLAKPLPRWGLLAGRCLGVLAFVAVQALTFLGATWLALGLRTGTWEPRYWLSLPLLLLHFAIFFAFAAMLAVATRSTVVSVLGTVLFWALCGAVNLAHHALHAIPDLAGLRESVGRGAEVGYWVLPKPLDLHALLLNAVQDRGPGGPSFSALVDGGLYSPSLSVLSSAAYALVLFGIAAHDFLKADY